MLSTVTGTWSSAPSVVAGGYSDFAWIGGYCYSGSCTATIDLGGSYSAVGGFMNYATGHGSATISAIAADGTTVLESYDLTTLAPISTPGGLNAGDFRGIERGTSDIAFLQLSGSYLIAHDLTVSPIPEPETYAMLLAGLGLLGFMARRKKVSAV